MVEDIDLLAITEATILVVQRAEAPIQQQLSEPLFWSFDHQTSDTSGSIGLATSFGSLPKI